MIFYFYLQTNAMRIFPEEIGHVGDLWTAYLRNETGAITTQTVS